MKNRLAIAIILVMVVAGGLAAVKTQQIRTMIEAGQAAGTPPETVSSATVRREDWQRTLTAIGSISAVQGVNVTAEVPGTVSEIAFESGAMVARRDVLLRLDTTTEEAQLRALEAQANLAALNAERIRILRANNMVSQSDLDTAEATLQQDRANADAIRAAIEKKIVRAPFDGKLGIRLVNLGEYLEAGKPIVSLQALSPLYANFTLPQQELSRVQTGMRVRLGIDAYPGRNFEGTLTAINPDLDASTRSVQLQATLSNADQLLRPGMFARVEALLPSSQSVLVIPATSVLAAPYGASVFVLEPGVATNNAPAGLVARQQFVHLGGAQGDFVSVETGLKAGDKIAASGVFKLRNGTAVVVNNDTVPPASENPNPPDR